MLDLRRFRYLVVLAKRLSFSRAAEDLGLSQSALSRAIQSLERDIGMVLFDRDRAGVMLTEQGRWVVQKAEALLVSAQDFEHQLGFAARGAEGRMSCGMTAMAASTLLPKALAGRLRENPGFVHEVRVRDVETLWLQLNMGEIEFMICSEWTSAWPIPADLPVRIEKLGGCPIDLIVREEHPLTSGPASERRYPLLVSSHTTINQRIAAMLCETMATGVQVVEDYRVLAALVQETDAMWITSRFAATTELAEGTFSVAPWPGMLAPESFDLFMYSLVRRTKSPAVLELEQVFRTHLGQLAEQASPIG